jgi:transcriptional regulator
MAQNSIYLPPFFQGQDPTLALTLMREHPLGTLVSVNECGAPMVSHLPLKCEVTSRGAKATLDEGWVLWGHFARANPQVQSLQKSPQALAIFMGPQAYMSPSVYPDLTRVPTWNYVTLHAQGEVQFLDEPQTKDQLLKQLIADHELSYAEQWKSLDPAYQSSMLRAIIGFKMNVTHCQFKIKLNQHRPEAHEKMLEQYQSGTESSRGLALWMQRLGLPKAEK